MEAATSSSAASSSSSSSDDYISANILYWTLLCQKPEKPTPSSGPKLVLKQCQHKHSLPGASGLFIQLQGEQTELNFSYSRQT